ncbi:MAG: BON domain-containing protein [Acidobacteriota bacterium]
MSGCKHLLSVGLVGVALVIGTPQGTFATPRAVRSAAAADDSTLKSEIAASLKKNSMLAPRDIDVSVDNGVVTLKGEVKTAAEKTRAGRVAQIKGVARVDNRIEVNPDIDRSKIDAAAEKTKAGVNKAVDASKGAAEKAVEGVQKGVGKAEEGVGKAAEKTASALGKAGDKVGDASVTTKVKAGFSNEALLKETAIDIDTADGVVTLRGTVGSDAAKARAGAIATGTDGVTRVVNLLVVQGA